MDFEDLIRKRYSVRSYRPDPVDDAMLAQILEAGRLAPTAANRQPFRIVVIHTRGRQAEMLRIYPKDWFATAPIVLTVIGVKGEAWVRRDDRGFLDVDGAIVLDHMILAAAGLGLGTCWVGNFDLPAAREILNLPPGAEPIAFTPLGHPADQPTPKKRKPLSALVRYERW